LTDAIWQAEVEKIYGEYSIYHQSEGAEQAVFDQSSGHSSTRSARLLERLNSYAEFSMTGRLLDIGCGNGALLRTFGGSAGLWSLAGTELNNKNKKVVENINGVEALYTDRPDQVPGTFDIITMVHVLEHVLTPLGFIAALREKLEPGGLLVFEVPDYSQNPFDLLIEDHCTHFSALTLPQLIRQQGYEVLVTTTEWVPKELTVVARKAGRQTDDAFELAKADSLDIAVSSVQWLKAVLSAARQLSETNNFGVFGTSIAATWLFGELEESIKFFVDEDPNRIGRTFMGRPVYHPQQVPQESNVFVALPPKFAEGVRQRVARPGVTFNLPPSSL
jgi:2-polyprenyl-3-methyl-5-hydroxy-6-metoxy-1,4-benzoquinol methylase